jgi:hypothetical protein
MAKKRYYSAEPFENGMRSSRPGYGVSYSSPFPKNGFVDKVIMKDYPSEPYATLDNPYNGMEAIDKANAEGARNLRRAAASKKGPY